MRTPDPTGLGSATVRPADVPGADRPRGPFPSERLVLSVWALLTLVAVVVVLAVREHDAVHDPVQKAARGEVTGLGPLSLVRADRFAAALAALKAKAPDGRIVNLRLAPDGIDAQVRTPDYRLLYLDVDTALKVHQSSESESAAKGLDYAQLDPAVPQKLVRRFNEKTRTTPDDLAYLSLSVDSTDPAASRWVTVLARGVPPDQRSSVSNLDGSRYP
jgi:hypothetical protein